MKHKFDKFKEYIVLSYVKQDERSIVREYLTTPSKKSQFFQILEFVNELKFEEVNEELKQYINYGFLFDGINTLYYDTPTVSRLSQIEFNQIVFNHICHFLLGSHCKLNKNSTSAAKYIKATTILMASHFGLIRMAAKYSQSKRLHLISRYESYSAKHNDQFIFFEPCLKLADYLLNRFANSELSYDSNFKYSVFTNEEETFKTDIGIVFEKVCYDIMHLTKERGLRPDRFVKESIVMLKDEQGEFKRAYKSRKDSKELISFKEMYDQLVGKELTF